MSSLRVVVEADGGSRGNPGPAGYGAVVRDAASGEVLREVAAGIGVASNNVAEYRGLIAGLEAARDLGADDVAVRMDSLLVVNQMSGVWKVKHEAMKPLASEAAKLVRALGKVSFRHIPREQNSHADRLANEAMDDAAQGLDWRVRAEVPEPEPEPRRPRPGWGAPSGVATTMLLVRHGETPLSVERRFSGTSDPELTERGHAQARAVAERLARRDIDAVITSPRTRTRQTAAAIAAVFGVEPIVEEGVTEVDFGEWEGYTFAEISEQWPEELQAWLADPDVAPPRGESFTKAFARVDAARAELVRDYAGKTIVVVSHVTPIKAMVREALDAPAHVLFRVHLDPASLTTIDSYAGGVGVVRGLNDISHLGADLKTPSR